MTQLLGSDDLQNLFLALDLQPRDIESEQRNADTTSVEIMAWYVLRKWRNMLGRKATRGSILDALDKCRNVEAREILDYTWNQRGNIYFSLYHYKTLQTKINIIHI